MKKRSKALDRNRPPPCRRSSLPMTASPKQGTKLCRHFCTFLTYFACQFLLLCSSTLPKVLWYVSCGTFLPRRELCGKKTAAHGWRWTTYENYAHYRVDRWALDI